jgi:hypothetical protein
MRLSDGAHLFFRLASSRKLAGTAVVALLIELLPVRTIGYNENSAAAERVSVNPH